MVKDFDLNLKVETSSSEGKDSRYNSIIYCTPGCLTG